MIFSRIDSRRFISGPSVVLDFRPSSGDEVDSSGCAMMLGGCQTMVRVSIAGPVGLSLLSTMASTVVATVPLLSGWRSPVDFVTNAGAKLILIVVQAAVSTEYVALGLLSRASVALDLWNSCDKAAKYESFRFA